MRHRSAQLAWIIQVFAALSVTANAGYREEIDLCLGKTALTKLQWAAVATEPKLVGWWTAALRDHERDLSAALAECEDSGTVVTDTDASLRGLVLTASVVWRAVGSQEDGDEFAAHLWWVSCLLDAYEDGFLECSSSPADPPDFIVTAGGSLEGVYESATWGDVIEVRGVVEKFKMDANKYSPTRQDPIVIRAGPGGAMISMNPVGGSESIALKERGAAWTRFEGMDVEIDDRASLLCNMPKWDGWTYPGLEFVDCRFGVNGWDWESNSGFSGKWGLLLHGTGDFLMERTTVSGIQKEHANYFHNITGDHWFVGCTFENNGRTAAQFANRQGEGIEGRGDVWFIDCTIRDCCLQPTGGGSAISFNGGAPTSRLYVIGTSVFLGANPDLHPVAQPNMTGGLVVHQGEDTESFGGCAEVYVERSFFQVGPYFLGEGSARRPNLSFSENIGRVTIVGTTVHQYADPSDPTGKTGASNALTIDATGWVNEGLIGKTVWGEIGEVILDRGNDIRGHCEYDGREFKDEDLDRDGLFDGIAYQEMLAAIESDPRVTVIDWDGAAIELPEYGSGSAGPGEPPPPPPPPGEAPFDPAEIPGIWGWWRAGQDGANLALGGSGEERTVLLVSDSSPNGRILRAGPSVAGYRAGVSLPGDTKGGAYTTNLGFLGADRWVTRQIYGNTYEFGEPFPGDGAWYVAVAFLNTRRNGERELLGLDGRNWLRVDQSSDLVTISVDGEPTRLSTVQAGLVVLELWRGESGAVTMRSTGVDRQVLSVTTSEPVAGNFALAGIGYDGQGTSQWDDYLGEILMFEGIPDACRDGTLAEYLLEVWDPTD